MTSELEGKDLRVKRLVNVLHSSIHNARAELEARGYDQWFIKKTLLEHKGVEIPEIGKGIAALFDEWNKIVDVLDAQRFAGNERPSVLSINSMTERLNALTTSLSEQVSSAINACLSTSFEPDQKPRHQAREKNAQEILTLSQNDSMFGRFWRWLTRTAQRELPAGMTRTELKKHLSSLPTPMFDSIVFDFGGRSYVPGNQATLIEKAIAIIQYAEARQELDRLIECYRREVDKKSECPDA